MPRERWLHVLVAADVVLAYATIGAESILHKFLPGPLAEHQRSSWLAHDGSALAWFETGLWLASVATFVLAWIALVMYWRRARELYLAAWGLTALSLALRGPAVWTAPGSVLDTVGTLVSGSLIGLVWFSDLAARYGEPQAGAAAPAGA
jgi:hypothetical protein